MTQKNIRVANGVLLIAVILTLTGLDGYIIPVRNQNVRLFIAYVIVLAAALIAFHWKKVPVHYILPYGARTNLKNALIAIALCFTSLPAASTVYYLTKLAFPDKLAELSSAMDYSSYNPIYLFFILAITPAFGEELLSRGLVFGSVRQSGNARRAILVSALFFGLIHLNFSQFFYALAIGIVFGIERERTGCLWTSMIHHLMNNSLTCLQYFFLTRNMTVVKIIAFINLDYVNHPIRSAIIAIVGLVLTGILLRALSPVPKAAEEMAAMDEAIAEDRASIAGRKPTGVSVVLVLVMIYLFTATIFVTYTDTSAIVQMLK